MSSEQSNTATEQPAQVAQTSSEKKGAGNTSISDFARKIAGAQVAPTAFTPKTESPKEEAKATTAAPVTEEAVEAPAVETTEETEGAQAADATEEETTEVLSPETTSSLDPKLQAKIHRRIGKEVAKTKKEIAARVAAETRAAQLEAQLAERQESPEKEISVPVPANQPLAEITSLDALNQYREALSNDIVEAEMLLHMDIPAEGIQTKWGVMTKPALISALTQAKKAERSDIPARERFLTSRTQATQSAFEKFPFLKDPTHPGYQMAQAAKRDPANAWLRGLPNADYILGVQIKGLLAMQAEETASTVKQTVKPKQKPTAGQSEIASDASISRAPTGLMNSQALQVERAKATGGKKSLGHKDFAELLKANQRFRNSQ